LSAVYYYCKKWKNDGLFEEVMDRLNEHQRKKANKSLSPSVGIIDGLLKERRLGFHTPGEYFFYILSGTSMPSSDIAVRITRATFADNINLKFRNPSRSSRKIEQS